MPAGRPSKYKAEMLDVIQALAEKGCTDYEISKALKINYSTFRLWKNDNEEILAVLNAAKEKADQEIEKSLYQRAHGYKHKAVKIFCLKDGTVVEHPYVERFPPDPTSMIFWLKNRQRDRWRDKQDIEHSGKVEGAIINFGTKPKDDGPKE